MIAIKNADGTLVPVIDSQAGANRSVALSLVHSHQKRAEILLYELQDATPREHVRDLEQPEPFGKLVLRHLPDNPFGEVEIQAALSIDPDMRLHVTAVAAGEKPVKGNFRIPSAGLDLAERQGQMTSSEENDLESDFIDDLFDPTMEEPDVMATPASAMDLPPPAEDKLFSSPMDDAFTTDDFPDMPDFSDMPDTAEFTGMPDLPDDTDFTGTPEMSEMPDFPPMPEIAAADRLMEARQAQGNAATPDFSEPSPPQAAAVVLPTPLAEPRKTKPAKINTRKSQPVRHSAASLGQKLMWASAGLFSISLIEIGLYLLLRMRIL